jgi:Tfp pilus assembly protein PilF
MIQREQIEALEILGHMYFRQSRPAEARVVFAGILALDAENKTAQKHLAALALERGDGAEALQRLAAYANGQEPGEPAALLMRVQAMRLAGRTDEVEKVFRAYLQAVEKQSQAD